MVAVIEELSKAGAVIWGTWLSASALRLAMPGCSANCRLLVESPRALMLAGLAAGCGFMTIENVGYLISSGLIRDDGESVIVDKLLRWAIMVVRVVMNIHPWMAGITCARIARLTRGRDSLSISVKEFAWALYPAVLIHAAFDFGLLALSIFAMFAPMMAWFGARHIFEKEWEAFEPDVENAEDPSEESTEQEAIPTVS